MEILGGLIAGMLCAIGVAVVTMVIAAIIVSKTGKENISITYSKVEVGKHYQVNSKYLRQYADKLWYATVISIDDDTVTYVLSNRDEVQEMPIDVFRYTYNKELSKDELANM